jgi:hypothetical protein
LWCKFFLINELLTDFSFLHRLSTSDPTCAETLEVQRMTHWEDCTASCIQRSCSSTLSWSEYVYFWRIFY